MMESQAFGTTEQFLEKELSCLVLGGAVVALSRRSFQLPCVQLPGGQNPAKPQVQLSFSQARQLCIDFRRFHILHLVAEVSATAF